MYEHMKDGKKGHHFLERVMKSDGTKRNQFLFVDTKAVKYLSCGHLMHLVCLELFESNFEMRWGSAKEKFDMTDRTLSAGGLLYVPFAFWSAFCFAGCDIFCFDSRQPSNGQLNFIFKKFLLCPSYSTRVEHIDPNNGTGRDGPLHHACLAKIFLIAFVSCYVLTKLCFLAFNVLYVFIDLGAQEFQSIQLSKRFRNRR